MAAIDDVTTLITAVNTATNAEAAALQTVSDRIDKLVAELAGAAGGLSAADVANVTAQLQALSAAQAPIVARLTALGADPTNPVPAPAPAGG